MEDTLRVGVRVAAVMAGAYVIPALARKLEVRLGMKPKQKATFLQFVLIVGGLIALIALLGVIFD